MKAYLDPEDLKALEDEANTPRDRLLIRLLFHAGCRVSEALLLSSEDIDAASGTITIHHLRRRVTVSCPRCKATLARKHTFCPRCGKKPDKALRATIEKHRKRTIPVDPKTMSLLVDRANQVISLSGKDRALIFGINRHRAWQIVRGSADRAGFPKLINVETGKVRGVSPHRLRDAFAVNAIKHDDSGDGLRLLQEHLGHQNFNTTAKYRKISGEEQQRWYSSLWETA
jgi:integrase/recombinase XerD